MDARRVGALLLVGVLAAGLVLHGVARPAVTGTPVAAVVPAPPVPGDCVVALSPAPDGDSDAAVDYPYATFGRCGGPIVGEVMAVDRADHPPVTTAEEYQQASSLCELAEVPYVGWIGPVDPTTIARPGIGWVSQVTVESLSIAPTPLQRAAGQRWTACVGATRDRTTYTGTIAHALAVGTLPPQFGTCWRALVSSTEQQVTEPEVPCAQPHSVEILALTQITDPTTTPAQVAASCRGMASRSLRTTDPTVGGRLQVTAYAMDGSSVMPVTQGSMLSGFTGCIASVPAPFRLQGTVIGLGDKPLPLAR